MVSFWQVEPKIHIKIVALIRASRVIEISEIIKTNEIKEENIRHTKQNYQA